jgi:hypothetical protein
MDKSYEVTPEDCNEAITQEIYIQAGFKTSLCVLLLNTGFEAVGRYAPIDIQDINISIGKEKSRAAAMVEVVKHLESVSQWAVDDLREQEKEEKSQAVLLQNQNVKYMITENQYLR